jgi:hypothetical protein
VKISVPATLVDADAREEQRRIVAILVQAIDLYEATLGPISVDVDATCFDALLPASRRRSGPEQAQCCCISDFSVHIRVESVLIRVECSHAVPLAPDA